MSCLLTCCCTFPPPHKAAGALLHQLCSLQFTTEHVFSCLYSSSPSSPQSMAFPASILHLPVHHRARLFLPLFFIFQFTTEHVFSCLYSSSSSSPQSTLFSCLYSSSSTHSQCHIVLPQFCILPVSPSSVLINKMRCSRQGCVNKNEGTIVALTFVLK